ncbi:MAG: hypothetical protein JEZ12_25525 [Desulfobacterium sp.]|nr:hypothetical protein [Desulfobacterium sp.]
MNPGNTVNGDQMKESARTVKEGLEKDQAIKPEESPSTLNMDQRIKLMEFAHEKTRISGSWEDAYKEMVELLTGVPVNLPGDVLDILKKIDVGEYHLSITPFSEIHFLSLEESADLERHMNNKTPPTPKRDFSKTGPGEDQKITIIKRSNNRFTIHHKHEAFSFETYGAHSFEGVIKSVENLLNGCKPTLHDHYLKSDSKPPVHTEGDREPKPLD